MIHRYKLNEDLRLAVGLKLSEFECKCKHHSCRYTPVSQKLLDCYTSFRVAISKPMIINSGYRCNYHNYQVGGSASSYHQLGCAIDISRSTFSYMQDDEIRLAAIQAGFKFVKIYEKFVHLDTRGE